VRVAIVMRGTTLRGSGGAERRFSRVFTKLVDEGFDVHLVINSTLHAGLVRAKVIKPDLPGLVVIPNRFRSATLSALLFCAKAADRITKLDPQLVHLPLIQQSLLPLYLWLYAKPRLRVVTTVALVRLAYDGQTPWHTELLSRLLFRRSSGIDSLYPSFTSTAADAPYTRITSISPGSFTDPDLFRPIWPKRKVVTFCGRLAQNKNPLLLVEALARIKAMESEFLNEWQVIFLGAGPLKDELCRRIAAYGLRSIVQVEAREFVAEIMNTSRIFVSLHSLENYPSQALLEAMAAGNAVVATGVGQTSRLVIPSTGILLRTFDPAELAEVLLSLMKDEARCRRLGENARMSILADHTVGAFTEYLKRVWSRAVN